MKLWALGPELVLGGLCLVLVPVAGLARGRWRVLPAALAGAGLLACIALTAWMLAWQPVRAFDGIYAVDGLANVFKLLILTGALVTVGLLASYFRGEPQLAHAPVAVLFSTLGAVGLASSLDLVLIVLFLQLMSVAGYVLVALVRSDGRALEAALKYFIYGAVALAVMAYGLTFLYGLTGSLHLEHIGAALTGADRVWVSLALLLALAGYGFEIAAAPFHQWAPDVLEGATAPVSGYLSVVPKVAAVAALLRFLQDALPGGMGGWPLVVGAMAALSMTLGNLLALKQTRLKRLLAWSSVAQAGYVLMAVAVAERAGTPVAATAFYLAAYLLMNLGAFAVAAQVERASASDSLAALRGLHARAPWPAAVLAVLLLSLAGLPPLAGFAGKVLLLEAAIDGGFLWLAIIAAANMAVALFYYARVIGELYLRAPIEPLPVHAGCGYSFAHALTLAGTLALGIFPGIGLAIVGRAAPVAAVDPPDGALTRRCAAGQAACPAPAVAAASRDHRLGISPQMTGLATMPRP